MLIKTGAPWEGSNEGSSATHSIEDGNLRTAFACIKVSLFVQIAELQAALQAVDGAIKDAEAGLDQVPRLPSSEPSNLPGTSVPQPMARLFARHSFLHPSTVHWMSQHLAESCLNSSWNMTDSTSVWDFQYLSEKSHVSGSWIEQLVVQNSKLLMWLLTAHRVSQSKESLKSQSVELSMLTTQVTDNTCHKPLMAVRRCQL